MKSIKEELHWQNTELTDWLTDWQVKNIVPSANCCMGLILFFKKTSSKIR